MYIPKSNYNWIVTTAALELTPTLDSSHYPAYNVASCTSGVQASHMDDPKLNLIWSKNLGQHRCLKSGFTLGGDAKNEPEKQTTLRESGFHLWWLSLIHESGTQPGSVILH